MDCFGSGVEVASVTSVPIGQSRAQWMGEMDLALQDESQQYVKTTNLAT